MKALDKIRDHPGYCVGFGLVGEDLARTKDIIRRHLAEQVMRIAPDRVSAVLQTPLENYHTIAHLLPHNDLLTRTQRILPQWAVDEFRSTSLIRQLEQEFGAFAISDEERIGRESISIRIVRPNMDTDVGPLHADDWFWKLYDFKIPEGKQRLKVWIAICCEAGKSGLMLSPDSHEREWRYQTITKAGMLKPLLEESEKPDLWLFDSRPGDAVAFNYRLLHGGAVTRGTLTRVSMEFTVLVPDHVYFERAGRQAAAVHRHP